MITPEREKAFWERCGFGYDSQGNITLPGSTKLSPYLPSVESLDDLFEWAVPIDLSIRFIRTREGGYGIELERNDYTIVSTAIDKDPATALFLALEKVFNE